jgi:hypothetical protein
VFCRNQEIQQSQSLPVLILWWLTIMHRHKVFWIIGMIVFSYNANDLVIF